MIFKGRKAKLIEAYFIKSNFMITNKMLVKKLNVSHSTVTDTLRKLINLKIICRSNIGRKVYYKKIEK